MWIVQSAIKLTDVKFVSKKFISFSIKMQQKSSCSWALPNSKFGDGMARGGEENRKKVKGRETAPHCRCLWL